MARDPFLAGRRLSWVAVIMTGLAAFAAIAWLRDGMPGAGAFDARMKFVSEHSGSWVAGWLVRMVAAVFLLAFLVALSRSLTPGHPILRSVAVPFVTIGVAAELLAGALAAVVLPSLAERVAAGEAELVAVARTIEALSLAISGTVGIAMIGLGGALITHAAFRTPPFPRSLALASAPIWAVALASAGATLAGGTSGTDFVIFLFLPLAALWIAGVATTFFRPPARA